MRIFDEGPVLDSEIDSLGHMNVRYYVDRVARANRALLAQVGIGKPVFRGAIVRRFDTYCRFRREQFAGAHLQVAGGVLDAAPGQVRCYFEIRNPAKDEIAASFVTGTRLIDPDGQQVVPLPEEVVAACDAFQVPLPEHGQPRSLSLAAPRSDVSMAELIERVPADPGAGMMSGRRDVVVLAEDCDEQGWLREDVDVMFMMHRVQVQQNAGTFGPPVLRTDEGHRFSWAMIETRNVVLGRPRAGDNLVSIGADVAFGERWRQSRRWAFVESSGELVSLHDTVGIALDLDARRSIPIPAGIRADLERTVLPDLL